MLKLRYKNHLGEAVMYGSGQGDIRICEIEGLGGFEREYNAVVYSNCDGQETLGSRAAARSITVSLEVQSKNAAQTIRQVLQVLSAPGMLYIEDSGINRRIYCNQAQIPDTTVVLKGYIATFAVQFICDSPYFEDGKDTVVPLYRVTKLLSTPFTLPTAFGSVDIGADITIKGIIPTEPVIDIVFLQATADAEQIVITNRTTGKSISLEYTPQANEHITIDIAARKITSSVSGNIINYLSDDTFLGDFVLKKGINKIELVMGDVGTATVVECRYNNLYNEAVIV